MGEKIMDAYLQVILTGLGAGLGTGTMVFLISWGVRTALGIMEIV
jgi:hypothetical protein